MTKIELAAITPTGTATVIAPDRTIRVGVTPDGHLQLSAAIDGGARFHWMVITRTEAREVANALDWFCEWGSMEGYKCG